MLLVVGNLPMYSIHLLQTCSVQIYVIQDRFPRYLTRFTSMWLAIYLEVVCDTETQKNSVHWKKYKKYSRKPINWIRFMCFSRRHVFLRLLVASPKVPARCPSFVYSWECYLVFFRLRMGWGWETSLNMLWFLCSVDVFRIYQPDLQGRSLLKIFADPDFDHPRGPTGGNGKMTNLQLWNTMSFA